MAYNRGLKAIRDLLVLSYFDDLMDDHEFLMLYDARTYTHTGNLISLIWMLRMIQSVRQSYCLPRNTSMNF